MYVHKNKCRMCQSENLTEFLDLGEQPLANAFLKNTSEFAIENFYPLKVYFCHDCYLAQLLDVVDKEILFKNYIYFSSGMPKLSDHFKNYAEDVMNKYLEKNDFVVELASNDGLLLKFFKDSGYRILGIDPAENIAALANSRGVLTWPKFFNQKLAEEIVQNYGPAKVILANNVVAHIDDHHDLAKGIKTLLAPNGVFVFEAPYLIDMFDNLTFDTIYHEHLSYLTIRPLKKLFEKYDLEIFKVEVHPVQGQSMRVFINHSGQHPVDQSVDYWLLKELAMELHLLESYQKLALRIAELKNNLINLLKEIKMAGKKIAGYGAPAKGNTLLNYCHIDTNFLDFALEDLPAKQGLYTPGSHIPTVNKQYAENHQPDYYLLLAWNYAKVILEKESQFRKNGGQFIIPVEGIKII